MPRFVIERELPGIGNLSPQELKAISKKSCSVLTEMGTKIQWIQSYVTPDKLYCIYIADTVDLIMEHAKKGGFPADSVAVVSKIIDLTTAED